MAIQRIVKMTFKEEYCESFEKFFTKVVDQIAGQDGCHGVRLLRCSDDKRVFFTYSVWEDETALDNYRNSDLFGDVWPTVKEWFDAKPQAWSTTLIHEKSSI